MVKSCTVWWFAGCRKSWCMKYYLLYCYSKGLIGIPAPVMYKCSVLLWGKHTNNLLGVPFEENGKSPYQITEQSIAKLIRYPKKTNLLKILDIFFVMRKVNFLLRYVKHWKYLLAGYKISVFNRSGCDYQHNVSHSVTTSERKNISDINPCHHILKMIKLETSVLAAGDQDFQRLQEIMCMYL